MSICLSGNIGTISRRSRSQTALCARFLSPVRSGKMASTLMALLYVVLFPFLHS